MPPTTDTAVAAYRQRFEQIDVPERVEIVTQDVRSNGTATLKIYDHIDGYTRESSVTLRSDAREGFVITDESSFVRADASVNDSAATLINAKLAGVSSAAWFKEAVLRSLFTRNDNLTDDAKNFAVLTDPGAAPIRKLHALQDMLATVAADPKKLGADEHALVAAALLNLPPDFWTTEDFAGVPWAELYFTADLLKKAGVSYAASIGLTEKEFEDYLKGRYHNDDEALGYYRQSLVVCGNELTREQYGRWCPERYSLLEATVYDPPHYRCDEHDVQVALATDPTYGWDGPEAAIMTPPLIAGTPDSLVGVITADATEAGMNAAVRVLPEVIENNPKSVAQTVRAIDETLKDEDVRSALADLSVTMVDLVAEILADPDLSVALSGIVEDVIHAAASGRWFSAAALEDMTGLIRQALARGLGVTEDLLFEDENSIRVIAEKILSVALEAARSDHVASEVEETVLTYVDVAGRVLADPRVQDLVTKAVGVAIKGGTQTWRNILANPQDLAELEDLAADAMVPVFDSLSAGLDTQGKKSLAQLLSHLFAASATAAIQAQEEPEMVPLMDLVGSEVVPKLEEFLAYQMMTPAEKRKAARERRREERKNALPQFTTSGNLYQKLTYPADPAEYFTVHDVKTFADGAYRVNYHVGAKESVFEFGAIEANMDVSDRGFTVEFARGAFTNYPKHELFFLRNDILEAAPLLDATLKTSADGAAYVTDRYGNRASYVDAEGRPHYLIYQHLSVAGVNSEYLLDLWVDKDDFPAGSHGEMVVGWDVVPTTPDGLKSWPPVQAGTIDPDDVTAFCKRTFTKGWTHPEQNTGAWQLIDEDGDGIIDVISWGAAISGTEGLQKLAPGPFTKNVYDVTRILEEIRAGKL